MNKLEKIIQEAKIEWYSRLLNDPKDKERREKSDKLVRSWWEAIRRFNEQT